MGCTFPTADDKASCRPLANELFFFSVIPANAGNEEYAAAIIGNRFRRTGIDKYVMSYPLHPQGDDLTAKARIFSSSFCKIKKLLADTPQIKLGILLQSTIGHGGVWNRTPENSLQGQHIVFETGESSARFCPYEQNFLDYITEAVSITVAGKPDFIMGDDDMRMMKNCFCPQHLQRLNKLAGTNFTRETLAEYLENAPPHDPVSEKFETVNREGMDALAAAIRKGIDRIDPAIPCGVCTCAPRFDYAKSQLTILGPGKPFVLRLSNSYYREEAPRVQSFVDFNTAYQAVNFRKLGDFPLLDESDTCPHHRYSKSAATMNMHIVSSILHGASGGKLWFDQSIYPMPEIFEEYEEIFAKYSGFYRTLHSLMKEFVPEGAVTRIPPFENEPFPHNGFNYNRCADWGAFVLGKLGIPAMYADMSSDAITLLAGDQVNYFSDDELRKLLSGKLLVDGGAALLLTRRGFSALTGVKASAKSFSANMEENSADRRLNTFSSGETTPFFEVSSEAEVLSTALRCPHSGAAKQPIMPASAYFCNSSGGKVISMAMNVQDWPFMYTVCPGRKYQLRSFLRLLGGVPAELAALQDAKLITGKLPDGRRLWAVINYSYDPLKLEFITDLPVKNISEAAPDGKLQKLPFSCSGNKIILDRQLPTAGVAAFIIE